MGSSELFDFLHRVALFACCLGVEFRLGEDRANFNRSKFIRLDLVLVGAAVGQSYLNSNTKQKTVALRTEDLFLLLLIISCCL